MLTKQEALSFHCYVPAEEANSPGGRWLPQANDASQTLARRYHMVERVRAARFVGIVVGTLGASCYIGIIRRIEAICRAANRKVKTFVVGKLNVPKLANFSEVDVFVLVACPLSTLVDSKEYFAPIVTPFELELALAGTREWDGTYETDFTALLPSVSPQADPTSDLPELTGEESSREVPEEIRSVVGSMMELGGGRRLDAAEAEGGETTLAVRHKPEGLLTRSFQGLLVALGETAPVKAVVGQSGIARGYTMEERGMFEATSSRKAIAAAKEEGSKEVGAGAGRDLHSVKRAPALDADEMAAKRAQAKSETVVPTPPLPQEMEEEEEDSGSEMEMDMGEMDDFEDALDD